MKLFSTSCETQFLGWDAPLLPRAVAWLRERYARAESLDLSSLVCVLPASRGVRRLDSLLRADADANGLNYQPPTIITVGQLPERLYRPEVPVALEFEQTLAWARALRSHDPEKLQPLLSVIPSPEPLGPWLELAGTLRRLHEELSSSQLTFAEVVDVAETESEQQRWKLLRKLFATYQSELDQAGLADPHLSRRQAVLQDRCSSDRTIVLVGTSDLSDALIAMLRSLDSELISLIASPGSEAFRFDEFGCVDTAGWIEHHLPIEDRHLISGGDIADQATAVAETMSVYAEDYAADQVTVGITDESQVGPVEIELRGCGVAAHRHLGWTIAQTAVGRLLDLTATYLQRRTWQSLAALVRHADVHRFVTRQFETEGSEDWLTQLDHLLAEHYPIHVKDPLPPKPLAEYPLAKQVGDLVEQWLAIYLGPDQSIAAWSVAVGQWLQQLYELPQEQATNTAGGSGSTGESKATGGTRERTLDRRTDAALDSALRLLDRFSQLNGQLDLAVPGSAAIEMLAGRLADIRIVDTPQPEEVELLGWLDLALDDSPALVVIGMNHPFVPGAVTSDPFLPGSLRTKLRMADNDRRFTRDLYAMHLMITTRPEVRFIVGRTAADQSPTPPSRLLAATPTDDAARRIRSLLGQRREPVVVQHRWDVGPDNALIPIPELDVSKGCDTVRTMSVTAFRDYLACPYRFYLRHVLKLRPLEDSSSELAANQFGDLVHGALERFGESDDRDETDRSSIESLLIAYLNDYAAECFGDAASTSVTLQIAQAQRRLKAVAAEQARRIADGWKIHATEASVSERDGACVEIDGKRMGLRGRFDRIDHNSKTGQWAILDYKTHGHKPEKKHLKKTPEGIQWIDLQLPLYRMMVPYLGIDAVPAEVQLGYFNVSEKDEETRINLAQFTEPEMLQADELIRETVARIWAGDFEPTADRVPFDDYSMILQTGVASRLLDQSDAAMELGAEA